MKISLVLRVAADFFLAANHSEKVNMKKHHSIYSAIVTAYGVIHRMDGYRVVRDPDFKRIMDGLREMGLPTHEGAMMTSAGFTPFSINETTQAERYTFMKLAQQLAEDQGL